MFHGDSFTVLLAGVLTALALSLCVVSLGSYWRTRSRPVAFITLALALFFAKGLALSLGLLGVGLTIEEGVGVLLGVDSGILLTLYLTTMRRG